MRTKLLKSIAFLILICIFLWLFNLPTLALDETKYYFGLKGPYHYPAGDFDGEDQGFLTIVQEDLTFEYAYDLHELVDNYGAGLTFGAYNGFAAGEISYYQSKHNTIWQETEQNQNQAILDILSFDFKFFKPNSAEKKLKLYGQFGLLLSSLSIKDCMSLEIIQTVTDPDTGDETETVIFSGIGSARYQGKGYNLGFGLMFNISEKLILDGSVIYQKVIFEDLKAFGITEEIPEDLLLTIRTYNLGIKYCF